MGKSQSRPLDRLHNLLYTLNKFRDFVEVTKSKGTRDYYKFYLNAIQEKLGHYDCDKIDNDVILKYIKHRRSLNSDISNASLNKHVKTLKSVVKYATQRKIEFPKLKEQEKIIPTVSEHTITKLFNYYKKHLDNKFAFRNYLFFNILLDTGLRLSEATHLKIDDLELDQSLIHVRKTKTDVDRYVVLTKPTKDLLIKFMVTQDISNYIFTDFKEDKPLTTSAVESFTYRIKKKLKIKENITPHKWRHTLATKFLRNGGNMEALRIILGHKNLKTTQKYLHLNKDDILTAYTKAIKR